MTDMDSTCRGKRSGDDSLSTRRDCSRAATIPTGEHHRHDVSVLETLEGQGLISKKSHFGAPMVLFVWP